MTQMSTCFITLTSLLNFRYYFVAAGVVLLPIVFPFLDTILLYWCHSVNSNADKESKA